jgi:hypothetical protein
MAASRLTDPLAALIEQLCDRDPAVRGRAAGEIFARGRERAARCASEWLRDAELAACFLLERFEHSEHSGLPPKFPRTTVGVAVHPPTFERILTANGDPRMAKVPPDLDAKEFELHFDAGVRLDILTTRDKGGGGAIARFLAKFGEGIQQVELSVRNVDRATELLRDRFGATPVFSESRSGADGTRVNFFLVADGEAGKLLIELVESPAP